MFDAPLISQVFHALGHAGLPSNTFLSVGLSGVEPLIESVADHDVLLRSSETTLKDQYV